MNQSVIKKSAEHVKTRPHGRYAHSQDPNFVEKNFFGGGPTRVIRLIAHARTGATAPMLGVFNAYGKEGPTASNLQELALPTSGQPIIFAPESTSTSVLRCSTHLAERPVTTVSVTRDLSEEEPVIQDASPSDHSFPDVPCECETLELDAQPQNTIHTEINYDAVLLCESSKGETEDSANGQKT